MTACESLMQLAPSLKVSCIFSRRQPLQQGGRMQGSDLAANSLALVCMTGIYSTAVGYMPWQLLLIHHCAHLSAW